MEEVIAILAWGLLGLYCSADVRRRYGYGVSGLLYGIYLTTFIHILL